MLVTILTACYNAEKTIAKTIESVLNQSYNDIEYIILDGKSTDNTLDIVNSYKDKYYHRFKRELRIYSKNDKGIYNALNNGTLLANGELIGQINAGDYYENDAVKTMVELYQKKNYDAAWGNILLIRCNKKNLIKKAHIRKIWTSSGWCHPACFSKKEVLLEYPYSLDTIYADFDFITNLYVHKKKIITINETIANFDFDGGGLSTKRGLKEAFIRANKTYYIYKKYNMSKLYYLYRLFYELIKCLCIGKEKNMKNNKKPKISIITVCRNEVDHISFTLDSILRQDSRLYELIILDGKSTDGTIEIIKSYEPRFKKDNIEYTFISEADTGIYNAMNKGITLAKYDYCIFMNGGDGFYDANIIYEAIKKIKKTNPDVLYGDEYRFNEDDDSHIIRIRDHKALIKDCTIGHQSTFIRTALLKERNYDESYRCAADYEYWLYLLCKGAKFLHFNKIVSYFRAGGISSTSYLKSISEVKKLQNNYEMPLKAITHYSKKHVFDFKNNGFFLNNVIGWGSPELSGTWMQDNVSKFCVNLKKSDYHFILKALCWTNYKNKLYLNDTYICDIIFENNTFECILNKDMIINGINTLSIKTDEEISSFSENDPRKLTIHVTKMMFLNNISYSLFQILIKIKKIFLKLKNEVIK